LNTKVRFAWSRVPSGQDMPGMLALLENVGIGRVIDDILLAVQCYEPDDIKDQVVFIPI
jgi:hypothetical protein